MRKSPGYFTYRIIVKEKFNINFHVSKNDRCDVGDAWENAKHKRDDELTKVKEEHDREKELSENFKSKLKERAKNDYLICVSAFDFQKTLLAPAGNSSSFYYRMKLRLSHFTVSNISCLKNVHCFLRSEDEARKGFCLFYFS